MLFLQYDILLVSIPFFSPDTRHAVITDPSAFVLVWTCLGILMQNSYQLTLGLKPTGSS